MITLKRFQEAIDAINVYDELVDQTNSLGINLLECKTMNDLETTLVMMLADSFCCKNEENENNSEEIADLIYWWLYEDVEKTIIKENKEKIDVTDASKFYEYLCSLSLENENE